MRAWVAVLTLVALVLPGGAQAHAFLQSSTPGNGAAMAHAPRVAGLLFTEPVSASLSHVQLLDAHGHRLRGARVTGGRNPRELRIVLPRLATGAYRLTYSTVSRDDLHITRGTLAFGAGLSAPPAAPRADGGPGIRLAEGVAHLIDLIALCLLVGTSVLLAAGLPTPVRVRIVRCARILLPATTVASIVALAGKTSGLPLATVLAHTDWGHAMLVRELAAAGVLLALACRRHTLALALLVPVAAAEAASGHASALGAFATLTMTLHVLAAGLWVGGLALLALVLPGLERRDVLDALSRFGRLAGVSVAVLLATGLYSAGRQVASVDALLSTTYGWSLVAKLLLLALTGALGLAGLAGVRRRRPSGTLLRAEALAAAGLLVTAALLLSSAPAHGPQFATAQPVRGTVLASGRAAGLLVDVSAAPNRPGQNFVTTTILDTLRPSPGPVRAVTITFTRGAQRVAVPARRVDATHWEVAGTQLTAAGGWRITVAARRDAGAAASWSTPWVVGSASAAPTSPARHSRRPLAPRLNVLALAIAVLGGLALAWRVRARLVVRRPRPA